MQEVVKYIHHAHSLQLLPSNTVVAIYCFDWGGGGDTVLGPM